MQAHWPVLRRPVHHAAVPLAGSAPARVQDGPPVDVGAGVGRVLEQAQHPAGARWLPGDRMRLGTASWPNRERQPGPAEIVHDGPSGAQVSELAEDQPQPRLDLLIGVEADRPVGVTDQPHRQPEVKLATLCLVPRARVQPQLELVELGFAQHAGEAQQQPIVVGAGIVQPLAVGQQRPEQPKELDQPIPLAVAGQARGLAAEHQANACQAEFGQQVLEPGALAGPDGRMPQVLVDDPHPLAGPTQRDRALDQLILERGALGMVHDLPHGRLTHVHVGQPGLMLGRDRRLERTQGHHGCCPPWALAGGKRAVVARRRAGRSRAGGVGPAGSRRVAAAGASGGSAMPASRDGRSTWHAAGPWVRSS
jgi:hypothetical protein